MSFADWIGLETTYTPAHVMLIRIGIAAVLGGLIGFERGVRNGEPGLRTHILVAVAATLFMLLTFELYHLSLRGGATNPDPIRAIEAVTSGVAFLGAGAIFHQRRSIQGLVTGAGMWLAGAIGICVALGYYLVALVTTLLAVLVLEVLRALSHRIASRSPGAHEP